VDGDVLQASGQVAVVIPAKDEGARIAATVTAVLAIPAVAVVVVVDDGSRDQTMRRAMEAGAQVVRHPRSQGKGAALTTGAAAVAELVGEAAVLLFVDGDLGESAAATEPLIAPVIAGEADMSIAILPPQGSGGGHGFVVRLAHRGIHSATGWTATQPLSGMRCLTREAFEAAQPLATGWGVETGLTIDLLSAGYRIVEVPCDLRHRVTGSDWRGQLHRGRQYRDVLRAVAVRRLRRATPLRVLDRRS
jgi:glycosyltransferase involved in cell wall biosynthesis